MLKSSLMPLKVSDNRVPVYYAGGTKINRFRHLNDEVKGPEDWVGSLTRLPSAIRPKGFTEKTGISKTAFGFLDEIIEADNIGWLGEKLAKRFGNNSALLVKLLDAGERLPVHAHPRRIFAQRHLNSFFGKTEGWIVLDTDPGSKIWLGLREEIDKEKFMHYVNEQSIDQILTAMNEYVIQRGQVIYVPAGTLHAIGPGTLIAECQEPTSFSILCEYRNFGLDETAATLGLGWERALSGIDLKPELSALNIYFPKRRELVATSNSHIFSLFDKEGDDFFRAFLVTTTSEIVFPEQAFLILIVTQGHGKLVWKSGEKVVHEGETFVVPAQVENLTIAGRLTLLAFLPPVLD
jgi:mannose-6-phosphate isomerase